MTYRHMAVATIEKHTAQYRQKVAEAGVTNNVLDGIAMTSSMYTLCSEILYKYKTLKIGVSNDCNSHSLLADHGLHRTREVWLYFPNQPMALMQVGYGDYNLTGDSCTETYMVYSRNIVNEKIGEGKGVRQRNMLRTGNLKTALKNVYANLRPYTPGELAALSSGTFTNAARDNREKIYSAVYEQKHLVTGHNSFFTEMHNLLHSGYQFLNDNFRQQLASWFEATSLANEKRNTPVNAYYIALRVDTHGVQWADILEGTNMATTSRTHFTKTSTHQSIKAQDLPDDIKHKVAVLGTVAVGMYVEGVGMRVGETMCWVERDSA